MLNEYKNIIIQEIRYVRGISAITNVYKLITAHVIYEGSIPLLHNNTMS